MLARSSNARTIVEFGTSFGISTLHLAAALQDNGGGRLITTEFEPSKAARARENLTAGGLIDLVEIREGDALKTLSVDLPDTIDLVLLDGAKALYPEILSLVESRLKSGALIVADNADMSPDYLRFVRSPAKWLHVRGLRRGRRAVDADQLGAFHIAQNRSGAASAAKSRKLRFFFPAYGSSPPGASRRRLLLSGTPATE